MTTSTSKADSYQFSIWSRMIMMRKAQREKVYFRIEIMTGLDQGAIKRLVYLKKGDSLRIDYKLLKAFAVIFNVTVEQLENHPITFYNPEI